MASQNLAADEDEEAEDDVEEAPSAIDDFITWLAGLYDASLMTTFEMGSLAFFRSSSHEAMMDGLMAETSGLDVEVDVVVPSPMEHIPVRTVSASMFLPKHGAANFRREIRRRTTAPRPTPGPRVRVDGWTHRAHDGSGSPKVDGLVRERLGRAMREQYAFWDIISKDLYRQGTGPALMSGHTVIDERNFAMI